MKEQSKKITIATTLIMLAALLFVAMFGVITKGYKDYSMLHPDDALKIENPPAAIDGDGNVMDTSTIYPMPSNMTFASTAAAEEGITIRATLKPDNATFKDITWSLSFVNPASAWATGKTPGGYIKYDIQFLDGRLHREIVKVSFSSPFGEQLKLTATSVDNPSISASCIIDCAEQRNIAVEKIDLLDTNGNNALHCHPIMDTADLVNINKTNTIKYIPKYNYTANPYTIAATYTAHYELSVSPAFINIFPLIDKYSQNNVSYFPVEFSKLTTNTINIDNGVIFNDDLLVQIFGANILNENEYKIFRDLLYGEDTTAIFFTNEIINKITTNSQERIAHQEWIGGTALTVGGTPGGNVINFPIFKLSCKIDSNYGYSSQWYNTFSINKNTFDCSVSVNGISLDQQGLVL